MIIEIWKIILPGLIGLLGVFIGSYISYRSSYKLFTKQKRFENQRISFSRLMSLKIPWTQCIRTNIEARILCEYYETRYLLFSHNIDDYNEARKQNDRALQLIPEISKQQKETFETLGLIQTCFDLDNDLENAINDLFYYESIGVSVFPRSFESETELNSFKKKQDATIEPLLKREYKDRFDKILNLLKDRMD